MIGLYFTFVAYGLTADAHVRSYNTILTEGAGHMLALLPDTGSALQTRSRLLGIMLLFTLVLEIVGFVGVKSKMSDHDLKLSWYEAQMSALFASWRGMMTILCPTRECRGFTSNAILLVFYMSPLSTLVEVFKSRSSARCATLISAVALRHHGLVS